MEIVTRREERCLEIILKGELDHHGAHEIAGQLERSIESALPWSCGQGSACGSWAAA